MSKLALSALFIASVSFVFSPSSARADDSALVVMDATNLPYHAGDQIPANQQLKLVAGQTLSLIASDGRVISVKGPYSGPPSPSAQTQASNIGQMLLPLVQQAGAETATPGVIRDGGTVSGPNFAAWVIDTSHGGDVCISLDQEYDFWRQDDSTAATITLQPVGGGTPVSVDFDKGISRVSVPDAMTFEDGAQYKISGPTGPQTITIHTVPEGIEPRSKITAAWFLQKNCKAQGYALLKDLSNS